MLSQDAAGSTGASRWRTGLPLRRLPVLAILLAGTTIGTFISANGGITALALTALFVFFFMPVVRVPEGRS